MESWHTVPLSPVGRNYSQNKNTSVGGTLIDIYLVTGFSRGRENDPYRKTL